MAHPVAPSPQDLAENDSGLRERMTGIEPASPDWKATGTGALSSGDAGWRRRRLSVSDRGWLGDRFIKFGKRARRGGGRVGAWVSGCGRHFPDRADGHGSQAGPEGEGLLSRVHDKA